MLVRLGPSRHAGWPLFWPAAHRCAVASRALCFLNSCSKRPLHRHRLRGCRPAAGPQRTAPCRSYTLCTKHFRLCIHKVVDRARAWCPAPQKSWSQASELIDTATPTRRGTTQEQRAAQSFAQAAVKPEYHAVGGAFFGRTVASAICSLAAVRDGAFNSIPPAEVVTRQPTEPATAARRQNTSPRVRGSSWRVQQLARALRYSATGPTSQAVLPGYRYRRRPFGARHSAGKRTAHNRLCYERRRRGTWVCSP